jgi:hypothetical protein
MRVHDARDFPRRLTEQSRHLSRTREVGVELLVLAAE